MKTTILFTFTTLMFFSSSNLPPEFGNPNGTKFPGCITKKGLDKYSGCQISCDNGFSGGCSPKTSINGGDAKWYCTWTNADGSGGSESGTTSHPCNW